MPSSQPVDYSRPFLIEGPVGNNAFSYERRGASPQLWVPSVRQGTLDDVVPGQQIVFEDLDEHGILQSCTGLSHLVKMTWGDIPAVVIDNHNHAFYFWFEAFLAGHLRAGATLVHLDQHRDTRTPAGSFSATATLGEAFHYTNFHLDVGNYIVPARQAGLLGDTLLVTGAEGLADRSMVGRRNLILNIDLDFFAPEMSYIDFEHVRRFIEAYRPGASLITIATSPFFVDQRRAIGFLRRLLGT